MSTRVESDSIGSLNVPDNAYYGVQTLRGYNNFQISGNKMHPTFIKNIILVKKACAITNLYAKNIREEMANAIVKACDQALNGDFDADFVTDAIQGGAGTTVNMNVNEVIANRATEILGGKKGQYLCHPNDHVNCSQSTNDVIPTAGKLTVLDMFNDLKEKVVNLTNSLDKKAKEFDNVLKMGRTQLQDAVPIRLGQEFSAWSSGIKRALDMVESACEQMLIVNLGGTAIGTTINANKEYVSNVVNNLATLKNQPLVQAQNLIDATQNLDGFVFVSGALKTLAVQLSKMSNDLRLMSSGPKTGLQEIVLPAMQNGSSIMPGKVNPVIPEVVSQVAFAVIGNDVTITMSAEGGQLELNAFEPVIFYKLFESFTCLTNAVNTLTVNCIDGITCNSQNCENMLYNSVGIITALCPVIGYKKSAQLAKRALKENRQVKDLILEEKLLDKQTLERILDPYSMTGK